MNSKSILGLVVGVIVVGLIFWWAASNIENPATNFDNGSTPINLNNNNNPPPVGEETNLPPVVDNNIKPETMSQATIQTNQGVITIELFPTDAPKTVENFVTLAGKGYYDGLIFHRVIKGFMIQGGDPTGTGSGGPGYTLADELNPETESYKRGYVRGTVAMANAGPNTNGSQFFIMHADTPLPHNYTIFGRVTSGLEVVDKIASSPTDGSDRPITEVKMEKVTIVSGGN
ncbi:MAG: peptidylprolyl isomerase [Patescibacteria group bacterium]